MKSSLASVVAGAMSKLTLALTLAAVTACASAPPAPVPAPPAVSMDGVRRLAVVATGESHFTGVKATNPQQATDTARIFDEVVKWLPYGYLVPIARAIQWGMNWLAESDRPSATVPRDVTPAMVVAEVFAQKLLAAGPRTQIMVTDRDLTGDARRDADAIMRITVPAWGVTRVQDGAPPLVAAFADVRAEIVVRETGVVLWRHDEDVTHPERLPAEAFTADRAAARERLKEVLERAGRRLASELAYARGAQ